MISQKIQNKTTTSNFSPYNKAGPGTLTFSFKEMEICHFSYNRLQFSNSNNYQVFLKLMYK